METKMIGLFILFYVFTVIIIFLNLKRVSVKKRVLFLTTIIFNILLFIAMFHDYNGIARIIFLSLVVFNLFYSLKYIGVCDVCGNVYFKGKLFKHQCPGPEKN